jgi:Protein of unknown function (DUF998)
MPHVRARGSRLRAVCGLVGPAAFTAAWAVGTARQPGYSAANEHISGLAAPDARAPHVMVSGFLALGTCTVLFAKELWEHLGGSERAGPGPVLMGVSGVAVMVAGALRRDRMSNFPLPGEPLVRQSWRNDGHDIASVISHVSGALGMLALAARFRSDPRWRRWVIPTVAAAIAGSGLSGSFASEVTRPGSGILQRTAVSIPLGYESALAVRLLRD